jgi:starch-binding outer membrane protein, SusD/RagB family
MRNQKYILLAVALCAVTGCKKLIEIDPPKSTITTEQMFSTNAQAEWAVAGLYSKLIHGTAYDIMSTAAEKNFGAGLSTILGSFSSDEMYNAEGAGRTDLYYLNRNQLTTQRAAMPANAWTSAYKTIYDANAVLEGLAASTALLDSVMNQLRGEALTLRAFAYFYLVNFFGDLPLALTIDYTKTGNLARSPVAKVYEQIIKDLVEAKPLLAQDFSVGKEERVRVNAWFAEALLARVYLYTGQYQEAVNSASKVIGKTDYFSLEQNLANVFSTTSREAILQLKPTNADVAIKNATPEGYMFRPVLPGLPSFYRFTDHFLHAFEANDNRKTAWIMEESGTFTPYKYTVGPTDGAQYAPQPQYYMVMRLAELYLVRAEASLLLSGGNKAAAISDLNALRQRAGLDDLPATLSAEQVTDAIAHERRFELFAEWGHRWLDLKRTGKAKAVLSQIAAKQPWAGDYQLLYPIPATEIINNKNIIQNPGYEVQ